MNKTFKTLWNDVRRCYIVANEAQKSHGKPSRTAIVAVAVAAALGSASVSASYVYPDPGVVAQNSSQVQQAKTSWETAEYKKDWGLSAMKASSAYALGFHGQGVAVGMMDSGALLQKHPELSGDRFHASTASGVYGTTGNRYQTEVPGVDDVFGNGDYVAGEEFNIDGNWIAHVNDTHGTHVLGTIGANRDGSEFHGVSWGSEIYAGNTGGTDNTNYGLIQDYNYFHAAWTGVVKDLVAFNGEKRGGVINNSFGTNLRIDTSRTSLTTNTTAQTEYEYFLFKQRTGEGNKNFIDAAYDAVKDTNVVQVITTGNRDMSMPYYRALYPYFNPEAEQHWIAVAGLEKNGKDSNGNDKYKWIDDFNEAGNAKWWTVVAPGDDIFSSIVYDDHYESTDDEHKLGDPGYASYGGTSMAAPHVTGAMGVLMSRYQDMSAVQVRDVLFTTANHKNADNSNFEGWTVNEGQVDPIYGWGAPDLEKGMYGLGQLLGRFDYDMATTSLDVWSNDISQVALDQRKEEDLKWMEATSNGANLSAEDYELGSADIPNVEDATIDQADAEKWRQEYYEKRAKTIKNKLDNGLYDGKLVKLGAGTLVMTGNNTYRGGTTVEAGTLLGFAESFGVTGENGKTTANGKVTVNGGVFGVLTSYNDQFTMKGELTSNPAAGHSVDVTVNKGGAYGIVAGQDVSIGSLTLAEGSLVKVITADQDSLLKAYSGEDVMGSVQVQGGLTDNGATIAASDLAFFDTTVTIDAEVGKINSKLSRNDSTAAAYAATSSQVAMANALTANADGAVFADLVGVTKDQVRGTLASLSSDFHLAAQNATIVNAASMSRMLKDQANAYGEAQRAELGNGATLWATGMGSWGDVDAGGASVNMDVDYYAGFIGAELPYGDRNKVGVFFGYGQTDYDAGRDGDMDSDDIHIGMYGQNDWDAFGLTYGFAYTTQDRDSNRSLSFADTATNNAVSYNANVFQIFGEASWKGFNTDAYQVEPYVGLSWLKVTSDDFSERAGKHDVKTEIDDQNLGMVNVGVRGALPFTAGGVAMKVRADVGYSQFFGDKEATAKITVGDAGTANIKGEELSGMGMIGVGLDAAVGKNATFGVNYTGAFGSDITSHGIGAKLGIKF